MHAAHPLPASNAARDRGKTLRALRIGSGLVLAVCVTAHLCNHALGVFSMATPLLSALSE